MDILPASEIFIARANVVSSSSARNFERRSMLCSSDEGKLGDGGWKEEAGSGGVKAGAGR